MNVPAPSQGLRVFVLMEYGVEWGVLLGIYATRAKAFEASDELTHRRFSTSREIHELRLNAPAAFHDEDGEEL